LISQKEILELLDDPVATMAASLKEVAAHMSAILPKPDGSFLSVSERRIRTFFFFLISFLHCKN